MATQEENIIINFNKIFKLRFFIILTYCSWAKDQWVKILFKISWSIWILSSKRLTGRLTRQEIDSWEIDSPGSQTPSWLTHLTPGRLTYRIQGYQTPGRLTRKVSDLESHVLEDIFTPQGLNKIEILYTTILYIITQCPSRTLGSWWSVPDSNLWPVAYDALPPTSEPLSHSIFY